MTTPPPTPPNDTRRDLFRCFVQAEQEIRLTRSPLLQWSKRHQRTAPEAMAELGRNALRGLDAALAHLVATRNRLTMAMGLTPAAYVTAGYAQDDDRWQVEVHRPDQPTEIVPIAAPQVADEETARTLAEQIAENQGLPYQEQNRGLHTADHVLGQVREAAWMQGEDDPSLVAEVARLRRLEQQSIELGWSQVQAPEVVGHARDGVQFHVEGPLHVVAVAGIVAAGTTGPISCDPGLARKLGAALVAAAEEAERLQREQNEAQALSTAADADRATS